MSCSGVSHSLFTAVASPMREMYPATEEGIRNAIKAKQCAAVQEVRPAADLDPGWAHGLAWSLCWTAAVAMADLEGGTALGDVFRPVRPDHAASCVHFQPNRHRAGIDRCRRESRQCKQLRWVDRVGLVVVGVFALLASHIRALRSGYQRGR